MQMIKEIKSVFETHGYSLNDIICETMKKFNLKTLCHESGIVKASGVSATEIICLLLLMPLLAVGSINHYYVGEYASIITMQRDVFYRLKNNELFNWRTLLYLVAKTFKKRTITPQETTDDTKKVSAFILDDTTDQRTGFKMENISWVHDHNIGKSVLGFKTLVLAYFDGISTIPLDFTTHKEKALKGKKRKEQYKKDVKKGSHGEKRRKEASTSKIQQSINMIRRAAKNGFHPDYVLCDSWFTCRELMQTVRSILPGKMHIIAGIRNDTRKYDCEGQLFNAKEIIARLKETKKEKRCRKLGIRYYTLTVKYDGVGDVKLAICRYPGQKKWRVFITTDTSLSFVRMMEIYAIRWTIEVFFKECKQHLSFGKCQSRDFDAQITSTTICFILYIFLAYRKRKVSYEIPEESPTMGQMVLEAVYELKQRTVYERVLAMFEDMLVFLIDVISAECGSMDIKNLMSSKEYIYAKEILRSSFLFEQLKAVDNAA